MFANHAHLFPASIREEGSLERLTTILDECNIERVVAFAPFPAQVAELNKSPNHWLADTIENNDRIVGFGIIEQEKGDLAKQAEEMAKLGFKGAKLHPAYQKFNILDERLMDFYEAAQDLGLFLSFHTGVHWHRIKDYHPILFDEVAYYYPDLRFSMEHVGGYSFFDEALAVLINNEKRDEYYNNVFAGITSVFNKKKNPAWYLGEQKVEEIINMVGVQQLIFGLDFPYNQLAEIESAIQKIKSLPIEDEDKELILGGNLYKVLSL